MRHLFLLAFLICSLQSNAQTTPPSVVRSPNTITQVDPYLTALRRLGIPTVAGDSLETSTTPQNSYKLIYNTALGRLRVYDPVSGTWSDASVAGVEHINGKDGDLKIVAGSNVTIDNSKSDTIVINATGGGGGSVTASNGIQIMGDGSVGLGGTINEETVIHTGDNEFGIFGDNGEIYVGYGASIYGYDKGLSIYKLGNDTILSVRIDSVAIDSVDYVAVGKRLSYDVGYNDDYSFHFVPISEFSGGGNYLPLNITEPTIVEIDHGNSLMIGQDGNSISFKKPVPVEFSAVCDSFTGFDYTYGDTRYINGILYGVNFDLLDISDATFVGSGCVSGDFGNGDYTISFVGQSDIDGFFAYFNTYINYEGGEPIDYRLVIANSEALIVMVNDKVTMLGSGYVSITDNDKVLQLDINEGISSTEYYEEQYTVNSFVQKHYVDSLAIPSIYTVDTSPHYIDSDVSSIVTLVDGSADVYLPNVSQSIGRSIYIINDSSNGVEIMPTGGTIWQNGSLVLSITIPSGSTMRLINNGSYWAIFQN